jgi:Ca2+-binding EF-hand superfamily protein
MSTASDNPFLLTLPDLLSAKKKIAVVAADFDPKKTSLKGFEGHSLDPTEFREQLRRNFLISLTNAELGTLVVLFDKDEDCRVNSAVFINEFLRLGDLERKKMAEQVRENGRRAEMLKAKIQKERDEQLSRLCKYHVPKEFTPEEEKNAVQKFSKLALGHDSFNKIALQGFINGGSLTPVQFKEQLRRNFCLYLTPGEVAALVHVFDSNGDGSIDCHEFLQHFFKIGFIEREKFHKKHVAKCNRRRELEDARQQERVEAFRAKNLVQLSEATDNDRESLQKKMETISADYERREQWGNAFAAFDSASLDPTSFREILKNSFNIRTTRGELAVLVELYGTSAGEIDCGQFLAAFFLSGKDEKERRLMKRMAVHDRLMRVRKKYEEDMERELLSRKVTAIEFPVLPHLFAPLASSSLQQESVHTIEEGEELDGLGMSSSMTGPSYGYNRSTASTSRRKNRKPSVLDSIAPNRDALEIFKSGSIVDVYPQASTDTKVNVASLSATYVVLF